MAGHVFTGRRQIFTDELSVSKENVIHILQTALTIHQQNRPEIEYLYQYYRGNQPILSRMKAVRPEIVNKIVENRANEIVSFKVGYLMGEPIQYVGRGDDESLTDKINALNEFVFAEDKASKDKELADWFHICGTSYRMTLPIAENEDAESPFHIYTLDPRNAFVVYHSGLGSPPVMAVKYVVTEKGETIYSVYTQNRYFEVSDASAITSNRENPLGIPIVEYPANTARLGAFEIVLTLLDAINMVDSNRLDGVEQFVQALLLFHNVDIGTEEYAQLRAEGAIKFRDADGQMKADIRYLTAELNQMQTQTLVDHLYETVLTICGMPNRNGGTSTSDTGAAVIMRDGWSAAEARAKDTELMFKRSEKEFLKLALRMVRDLGEIDLRLSNVEIRFTRRNYENIGEKANVLIAMLNNEKIHPLLAFTHSGLFTDAELAYTMSRDYYLETETVLSFAGGDEGDPTSGNIDGASD